MFADEVGEDSNKTGGIESDASVIEDNVIQTGMSFFENLIRALSSPESTKQLVNKLTETDKTCGQTYFKIPVGSEQVVENGLKR